MITLNKNSMEKEFKLTEEAKKAVEAFINEKLDGDRLVGLACLCDAYREVGWIEDDTVVERNKIVHALGLFQELMGCCFKQDVEH